MGVENYSGVRNTVDIVIMTTENKENTNEKKVPIKELQVLLIKRDQEPFSNTWTLPGGFISHNVTITDTVKQKLYQKTGISTLYTEQLYTYGDNLDRDPRDRVITIGYIALTSKDKVNITDCHGDKETDWFWIDTVRNASGAVEKVEFIRESTGERVYDLGFDHNSIIIDAINRLSNKIMYTDIGFHLVPTEFTIKELQLAYEAVIGRKIAGFRRIIESKLCETGQITTEARGITEHHRPAKLYTKRNITI